MKRPTFPLYIEAWRSDPFTRSLPLAVRMIYLELLLLAWQEDGIDPALLANHEAMGRLMGRGVGAKTFAAAWSQLSCKFSAASGRWRNSRSERVRAKLDQHARTVSKSRNRKGSCEQCDLAEGGVCDSHYISTSVSTSRSPLPLFGDQGEQLEQDPVERVVLELFHELNASRLANISGCRVLRPVEENLKHIRARLADGCSPDEIRHVIAVCAAEVRSKPETEQWFNAVTPFRPDNFQRKLSQTVRGAPASSESRRPRPKTLQQIKAEEAAMRQKLYGGEP